MDTKAIIREFGIGATSNEIAAVVARETEKAALRPQPKAQVGTPSRDPA